MSRWDRSWWCVGSALLALPVAAACSNSSDSDGKRAAFVASAGSGGASGAMTAAAGRSGSGDVGGSSSAGAAGSGCDRDPPFTGRKALTVSVLGATRSYDVIVPTTYDARQPLSVVFEFHASGGKIEDAVGSGLHLVSGATDAAIFVYPQAIEFESYGVGWDPGCDGHDLPLVDAALAYVESQFCVDETRIFATGFSWGGDFANSMACCRADVMRAVASASGAEWGPEVGVNADCGKQPLTAYRLTYGDLDSGYPQEQFAAAIQLFTTAEGCESATDPISPNPCVAYRGCDQPVHVCKYPGMGHQFPTGWAADTWAFFSSFD